VLPRTICARIVGIAKQRLRRDYLSPRIGPAIPCRYSVGKTGKLMNKVEISNHERAVALQHRILCLLPKPPRVLATAIMTILLLVALVALQTGFLRASAFAAAFSAATPFTASCACGVCGKLATYPRLFAPLPLSHVILGRSSPPRDGTGWYGR
jgi:hypothetical protein